MPEQPRLAAVLLAAGASRRLGRPKQLVKLEGETLVRRAAGLLMSLGLDPVVVVTGHCADDVVRELQGLPLILARNGEWEQGMGGSIGCGMQKIPAETEGVLLLLCDQWKLNKKDLQTLVSAWLTDISRIIVSQSQAGKASYSGPPVIFPGEYIHELKCVRGKRGARAIIDRHGDRVTLVELENAAWDLDEPKDIEWLGEV